MADAEFEPDGGGQHFRFHARRAGEDEDRAEFTEAARPRHARGGEHAAPRGGQRHAPDGLRARAAERPADPLVSVLLPAFNEQHNVIPMLETLHNLFNGLGMRHELVVIDDGSRDATVEKVCSVMERLPVVLVQLSRNFGKEVALSAGIDHARGDVAVLIDCDFQHPPDLVPSFLAQWRRGYDMVYAVRSDRYDESLPKRAFTHAFYWLLNVGERNKIPENTQDFRVLDQIGRAHV